MFSASTLLLVLRNFCYVGKNNSDKCFGTPASPTTFLLRGQAHLCSVLYCTFGYLLCCVPIIHCYWSIQAYTYMLSIRII